MRRFTLIVATTLLMLGLSPLAAAQTFTPSFNAAAAPSGTHVQSGTPSCTLDCSSGTVTCSSYELAGVGNADATATLVGTFTGTVQCKNHGGNIVEVHSQTETVPTTTSRLRAKNGHLVVPPLSESQPSASAFESQATCPNPNWTPQILAGSIHLTSFTYTVNFEGFMGSYITITGRC